MNKELLKLYAGEDLPPAQSFYEFAPPANGTKAVSPSVHAFVETLPKPVRLIGDGVGDSGKSDQGHVVDHAMGDISGALRKLCKSIGATKFGLLGAIYALGAYGFSSTRSVTSFFQTEGRKSLNAPNGVVGPFSNTLPLDLSVDLDHEFASFACDVSDKTKRSVALEHEPGLLDTVLSAQKGPSISINLFPPSSPIRAGDLVIGAREFLDRRTEFDLNLVWADDHGVSTARGFYDQSHLSRERVTLFLEQQERLLSAALENPHLSCRDILAKARQSAPAALPQTSLDPSPRERLHQPFFDRARQSPNAVAIRTSKQNISYHQLAQDARQVAASLQENGVNQTDTVLIYAARDPALVAAILGVSATGAAFSLLDASYPLSRHAQIIEDLDPRFLIEGGADIPEALRDKIQTVPLNASPDAANIVNGSPRSDACHMFTSGTTGKPKRITHPDTTLLRFVNWQAETLALDAPINTMLMSGLAHDPTLRDIFVPLSHGGTITIPAQCELQDPKVLRKLLGTSGCNVVRFSASTAKLLTTGAPRQLKLETLRGIFWGGERLPQIVPQDWSVIAPHARQFQIFGTTETPQAFLVHEIDQGSFETRDVPLGLPLPWTGARLVDADGQTVAKGDVGEIVAELPDQIKGIHQKHALEDTTSACQHFTGDMGYQRADGSVCFIGRRDTQIKVNGFRVELKEIEVAIEHLSQNPVAQAAFADDRLIAFVQDPSGKLTRGLVQSETALRLPSYMIPAQILIMPSFPVTSNGKIDQTALIEMARQDWALPEADNPKAAAQGESEEAIAAIYAKATGRPAAYRDATLADLGADSLATIETRLALEDAGFTLPDQWEWMSIQSLAGHRLAPKDTDKQPFIGVQLQNVDTFIVLRSIAIAMVVIHHTGLELQWGASLILIALAGFSFGRVNLPAILKDGRTGRIWAMMLKLLVPLVPVSVILFLMHRYVGNDPHIATLFLYTNLSGFVDLVLQRTETHHSLIWLWFLHVYLQIFLFLGVVFGVPKLRNAVAHNPWRAALIAFGCSAFGSVAVIQVASHALSAGDYQNMSNVLQHSPTTILPFFLIGLLFSLANSPKRIAVSVTVALTFFGLAQFAHQSHAEIGWLLALTLSLFLPYIRLPRIGKTIVMLLSVHALTIYLSHRAIEFGLSKFAGFDLPILVSAAIQLALGVCLGFALRPVIEILGINRLANKRISFGRQDTSNMHEKSREI